MKKLLIVLLSAVIAVCGLTAVVTLASAESATTVSTAEELLAISGTDGNYVLANDITLPENKSVSSFTGTFDGNGHTVTINNKSGLFGNLGTVDKPGTVKNLTVAGSVNGGGYIAGVASQAIGTIENVTVSADIVSQNGVAAIAGIANCNGKNDLFIKNCVFEGSVTNLQGLTYGNNYTYFGMFVGYNGGAFGGGNVVNSVARYTFTIPTSEVSKVSKVEFFNTSNDEDNTKVSSYTTRVEGANTVYTFDCVVNMKGVSVESINDAGIMANYGTPVVRFVLNDGSYRYLDGFDRANASYVTDFSAQSFNKMYKYADISDLEIREINKTSVDADGNIKVDSIYSEVTLSTAEEFESFARIVNSSVPATFKKDGKPVTLSILNTLATSIKLGADIDLTVGDENGNKSEFYGLGKQEFFPYRGGIDGNGHTLTVDINAPNGYCIGIISVSSDMSETISVKNLTVDGSIVGKTKVGVVGYFDMVCTEYVTGANLKLEGVTNNADVTGYTGVGGLIGVVASGNDVERTFIDGCENNGTITVTENGKYGGGIVGVAGFYGSNVAGVNIQNTVNNGDVKGEHNADYLGGIVGQITNQKSVLMNVEGNGTVSSDTASHMGTVAGATGAFMGNVTSGIGTYEVTAPTDLEGQVSFEKTETSSAYGGNIHVIKLNNKLSKNYSVSLKFVNKAGQAWQFKNADGSYSEEREFDAAENGYVIRNLEVDTYTVYAVVRNAEGYYSEADLGEDGVTLAKTASYTSTKGSVKFAFTDVEVPYTGSAVNYFAALDQIQYNKNNYKIPDTSADTGAKWEVEYSQNGSKLTSDPQKAGVYDVKITLKTTPAFERHYDFGGVKVYNARMTLTGKITVTVKYLEITKGEQANFDVEITTYDGTNASNIDKSKLGLSFDIKNMGSDTTKLPAMSYTVTVNGAKEYEGYNVEYKSGTLVVKDAVTVKPDDGDKKPGKKGCKLFDVRALFTGLVLTFGAYSAIRRKK